MFYKYALRTYVTLGVIGYGARDVNKLHMHNYCFVVTESYYSWLDSFRLSTNVHHNLTFIRRKYFHTEYMRMRVWPQHSITLVEVRFCLISMSFIIEAKVHSYRTLHIHATSALSL